MHCRYCDGVGEPEHYVEEALRKGLKFIGFSSHAPIPFQNDWTMREESVNQYLQEISRLKDKYKGDIEIYCGLEIDFFDGDNRNIFSKYNLDYVIGAVHIFSDYRNNTYYSVDSDDEDFRRTLNEFFHGDIKVFARSYYNQINNLVKIHKPHILGHFDVIKKNNKNERYFSEKESWYRELVLNSLNTVKENGTIIEVNTGGIIRGYMNEPYPSKWILEECKKKDIPITVNSDAHSPENIDGFFDIAYSMLREVGYTEETILKNGSWENTSF